MARRWVLDTETKGTGANVVPYEKTLAGARRERDLALVELGGSPVAKPSEQPARRPSSRFKVVDVLSSRTLAEGVGLRDAVQALEGARSVVDVRIYRWSEQARRWRLLSLQQARVLWSFRGRTGETAGAGERRADEAGGGGAAQPAAEPAP